MRVRQYGHRKKHVINWNVSKYTMRVDSNCYRQDDSGQRNEVLANNIVYILSSCGLFKYIGHYYAHDNI